MTCVKGVKAVLARTMFSLHALITLWRLVSQGEGRLPGSPLSSILFFPEGDAYTKIGFAILLQILEGLHSLCYRKGQELSWFCPSVFFYLIAVCPSVWILEIQMTSIRRERLCLYYQLVQEKLNSPSNDTRYQVSLLLELMQVSLQTGST